MTRKKTEVGDSDFSYLPELPEGRSLEDSRADVVDALLEGDRINCSCCGRRVKAYQKKLQAKMVVYLIELVAAYIRSKGWVNITTLPSYETEKQRADYVALIYWGMLTFNEDEKNEFRPTKDGYDFVRGVVQIPSHCFQFNGEIFGYSKAMVDVRQVLGDKYDYDELIKIVPIPKRKIKVLKQ